jgi:hypothetical protein
MYQVGNFQEDADVKNDDFWQLVAKERPHNRRAEPFEVAPVETQSAQDAYESVLTSAGATLPKRDAADARVVDEVRAGKIGLINSQADVDGWPSYQPTPAPQDSDNDGMPDDWEQDHGLNPQQDDHLGDVDGDGYPNVEQYLNTLGLEKSK